MVYCFFQQQRGFSLLELSIIILISSTIAVGYLTWTQPDAQMMAENLKETKRRMMVVESAIYQFKTKYERLPCPANPWLREDQSLAAGATGAAISLYGEEALQSTATTITCPVSEGAVPTLSLGIEPRYMYDAWGRQFRYQVSDTLCGATGNYGCSAQSYRDRDGAIRVTDAAGTVLTNAAAYVLVSFGKNGAGAFMPSGNRNTLPVSPAELENTDDDSAVPPIRFIQNRLITSPPAAYFDDIVDYITKDVLDNQSADLLTPTVTMTECLNNRTWLRGFTANGGQSINNAVNYGLGEDDDVAIMRIAWALQDACHKQYNTVNGITPDAAWPGKVCPGGATHGGVYDAMTESCSCTGGTWNNNC